MSTSHPPAKFDLHLESPPQGFNQESWEKQVEDAKVTFDKVLDGHYHGKSGYKKVACLLLTWKDDDMKCRETEVSHTVLITRCTILNWLVIQLIWSGSGGRIAQNIGRRFPL